MAGPLKEVKFKLAWQTYRVGDVITPNALLRDWLLANGYVEPVAVMKGTISLPLTQRVKNVVTRAARP